MEFGINNMSGIETATIEKLRQVEKQAKKLFVELIPRNDEEVEQCYWYREVIYRVDEELKRRGDRQRPEWEKLFV